MNIITTNLPGPSHYRIIGILAGIPVTRQISLVEWEKSPLPKEPFSSRQSNRDMWISNPQIPRDRLQHITRFWSCKMFRQVAWTLVRRTISSHPDLDRVSSPNVQKHTWSSLRPILLECRSRQQSESSDETSRNRKTHLTRKPSGTIHDFLTHELFLNFNCWFTLSRIEIYHLDIQSHSSQWEWHPSQRTNCREGCAESHWFTSILFSPFLVVDSWTEPRFANWLDRNFYNTHGYAHMRKYSLFPSQNFFPS